MPNLDTLSIQFNANGTTKAAENIRKMGYAVRTLANSIKQIDANKLGAFTSSMETLKKSVPTEAQTNRMVAFGDAVKGLSDVIGSANISGFSKDMSTLGDAVNTFKKSSVNSIQTAVTAMQQMGAQAQQTASIVSNAVPKKSQPVQMGDSKATLNATKEIIATLDKVQVKATGVQGVLAKMGIYVPTKKFKELENNAEMVRKKFEEVRSALQKGLNEGSIESGGSEYKKKVAELDALRQKYDELILKQRELAQEGKGFGLSPNIQKAFSGIKDTVSSFKTLSGVLNSASKRLGTFIGKLRSLGTHSKSTKRDTSSLADAAKKLSNEFFRVSKMLKLMVTRMALRKVIAEVGNGFKSLALHSNEFNQSVSNMMNASKQLGYSFASMVSPIINALAPAITYLINLLTKLANIINQVFSAITGATTWNKAKDFTENWADNISEANKAAKELKKTVLGFDELNQLQENKDTSGGGGANDIKDMFDTMPIEDKWKNVADYIKKLAKKLFDPIKKAWEKVGDFVKKSWEYAWNELLKLGQSVARDFWKMWEQRATQQIFENIFKIIGYIGQAVGNLARQFRIAWDENNTGFKILCNIRDIVLTITEHLKNMAKATADWADTLNFSPILTKFNEWLNSFKPVVDALMGVVEDFYTTVILPLAKWAVEEGGPQLLQVFIDFNNKVKWDELRDKLKTLWEHLEPFMETVGEGLIIFINDCAQALADFINSQEFEDFLTKIEEWMDSVTPQDVADGLKNIAKAIAAFAIGKAVVDGMVAIASFLGVVSKLAPLLKLAIVITVALAGLKIGGKIGEYLTGEKSTYENFSWWGKGGFFDTVFGGEDVNVLERIGELRTAWYDMAYEAHWSIQLIAQTLSGLLDPLGSIFEKVTRLAGYRFNWETLSFEKIKTDADDAGEAIDRFTQKAENYKNKIRSASDETGNLGAKFVDNHKHVESFSDALAKLKENSDSAKNTASSFSSTLASLKDTASTATSETDRYHGSLSNALSAVKQNTDAVPILTGKQQELANKFMETASKAKNLTQESGTAKTALDNLKVGTDNVVAATPKLTESQQKIVDSLKGVQKETEGTTVSWEKTDLAVANSSLSMSGSVKELNKSVDDATKDIKKQTDEVAKSFSKDKWTFSGVAEGLKKSFEDAKSGIRGVWNSIADKLNGEHSIGEGKIRINLPTFASGGFPEDGLFMANHHELVGHFENGKTAVANNTQIITGIENGVYNAMVRANNGQNNTAQYISNEIIVDGDVIARSVSKAQSRQNMRYSPQTT